MVTVNLIGIVQTLFFFLAYILNFHVCLHSSVNHYSCFPCSLQNKKKQGATQDFCTVLCYCTLYTERHSAQLGSKTEHKIMQG